MDLHKLVTNDYIQIAVILSGVLTLIVLSVQGYRSIIAPLIAASTNGLSKFAETRRNLRERELERARSNPAFLIARLATHILMVLNSIVGLLAASMMNIASNFLYVPGFRENARSIIVVDLSPDKSNTISLIFLSVSIIFFFLAFSSALSFALRVTAKTNGS
jgi:hypothetical protein